MLAVLLRWHRRLALIVALPVLLWVISGLTHPLMAHVWTPDVRWQQLALPSLPGAEEVIPPQRLLERQGYDAVDQINLVYVSGRPQWQVAIYGPPQEAERYREARPPANVALSYYDAVSGIPVVGGERLHAMALARILLGDPEAAVADVVRLDDFDLQYRFVNRLLPVHRVSFERDDGIQLYIDVIGQRLAASDNHWRRVGLWTFAQFHNWHFLGERHHPLRTGAITVMISLTFVVGLGGLLLYAVQWRKRRGRQGRDGAHRWHRRLGLVMALAMLGFASSGLHVVLGQFQAEDHLAWRADTRMAVADLAWNPLSSVTAQTVGLSQAWLQGEPVWQLRERVEGGEAIRYVHARTGEALGGDADRDYALALYQEWARSSGRPVQPVTFTRALPDFAMDYVSVYKRLPVQRLGLAEAPLSTFFVETHTGHVAHVATPEGRLRSRHFMHLHKYHFLGDLGLGPAARDAVISVVVLLILLVVLLGTFAWLRTYLRPNK